MFFEQHPNLIRRLYPNACWRMNTSEKVVYLTFDDGPIPEITPWVLDVLDKYRIKPAPYDRVITIKPVSK